MSFPLRYAISLAATRLEDAGIDSSEHDAKELYMYMTGLDRVGLMMHWTDELLENAFERYMELVDRRTAREPLQHITGTQEFMGLTFGVNKDVLIPRPETELVTEEAIRLIKEREALTVLDLCTGSGAIAVSIAKLAGAVKVTASDISDKALEMATENAKRHQVKVNFVKSDMFDSLKGNFGAKKYDCIVSNPPYIRSDEIDTLETEVRDHEPKSALDGGEDGLDFYRRIAREAPEHLKRGGLLVLEIGYDQGESVPELLKASGMFDAIEVKKDLNGMDRIVTAVLKGKESGKGLLRGRKSESEAENVEDKEEQ